MSVRGSCKLIVGDIECFIDPRIDCKAWSCVSLRMWWVVNLSDCYMFKEMFFI